MFCEKCGKKIEGNDKFCSFCGKSFIRNEIINKETEKQPTRLDNALKNVSSGTLLLILVALISVTIIYYNVNSAKDSSNKLSDSTGKIETNSSNATACTRKEPYDMPEEIKRALSLRRQRLQETANGQNGEYLVEFGSRFIDFENKYQNCYNIQYGDLRLIGGAEGVFWFDNTVSSPDNLQITIDNVYKFNDDLLLTIVLQHEIAHVMEFITENRDGTSLSCIKKEQLAFTVESLFLEILNKGEQDSLIQRLANLDGGDSLNEYSEDFFASLQSLLIAKEDATTKCVADIELGKIKKENFQSCKLGIEMRVINNLLEEYDYCG